MLLVDDLVAVLDLAADRFFERVEVEAGLSSEAFVEKSANFEEFVDRLVDFVLLGSGLERARRRSACRKLCVLSFFHPVVLHQALKQLV